MAWRSEYQGWKPYVPVAERRRRGAAEMAKLAKKSGRIAEPVRIAGKKIATTVWGSAWCTHLESFSDFANRLPRGRTYVRNGSVVDLKVSEGEIAAHVQGTDLYTVTITIKRLPSDRWTDIAKRCSGKIDSLVELLAGRVSKGVMDVMTERDTGLFPKPNEIALDCSCPDWASMCKHVAAVMYGIGARLDERPDLLFVLRGVDHLELIQGAASNVGKVAKASRDALEGGDLSEIFGIAIDDVPAKPAKTGPRAKAAAAGPAKRKAAARETVLPNARASKPRSASSRTRAPRSRRK